MIGNEFWVISSIFYVGGVISFFCFGTFCIFILRFLVFWVGLDV